MEQKKNSKKANLAVSVLVLLVGISIGGYLVLKSKASQADALNNIAQTLGNVDLSNDGDRDGLKDWEEKLYKTDPNNADTDGDGYLDGEEVAAGYDPTIPAPNDKIMAEGKVDFSQSASARPEPGNLTQMLGYILSEQMKTQKSSTLSAIQNDELLKTALGSLADQNVQDALKRAMANFLSEFVPPFKNGVLFRTTDDNSSAAIKQCNEQTKLIMHETAIACQTLNPPETLFAILNKAVSIGSFEQTDCLADTYKKTYERLSQMTTPQSLLERNKMIASFAWNVHVIFKHSPKTLNDPLKGVMITQKLKQIVDELIRLNNQLLEEQARGNI